MYTETAFRNRTRQYYYYCSRYRVYLRRDLPGKHVIVVKLILCYAVVDSRRFFCRRSWQQRRPRRSMRNRKPRRKNIVFNIMICIIVIVHCRRGVECVCTNISLPGIQVSAADVRHVPHGPQVLYIYYYIPHLYTWRIYLVYLYNIIVMPVSRV